MKEEYAQAQFIFLYIRTSDDFSERVNAGIAVFDLRGYEKRRVIY